MARNTLIAAGLIGLILAGTGARATDTEADQLRGQLRATVLQLRQLQDQQAVAPPPAAAFPDADSAKKLAAAQTQLRAARRGAAKTIQLQASLDKVTADNAALTTAAVDNAAELEKYKAAFAKADDLGRALTADRDGLKAELARITRVATACQTKNERLTAFGESMLQSYRKLTLGAALAAREPILGLKRVEFENIAQDREDTIRDNHCDPRLDAPRPAKGVGG